MKNVRFEASVPEVSAYSLFPSLHTMLRNNDILIVIAMRRELSAVESFSKHFFNNCMMSRHLEAAFS